LKLLPHAIAFCGILKLLREISTLRAVSRRVTSKPKKNIAALKIDSDIDDLNFDTWLLEMVIP
jgi:hypothetical protein